MCLVTFGGGLLDGDAIELDVVVEPGATLVLFTQATTKVFRGRSSQSIRAQVEGTLVLLPDPVAAFKDAYYKQAVDVTLGQSGKCVLLDGYTSGRAAFGEKWLMAGLDLRTTIRRASRLVLDDALRLEQSDGPIADRVAPYDAFATLITLGVPLASVPTRPPTPDLLVATSPLPAATSDGSIVRVAASSPSLALATIRSGLRNLPDIDVVDPFLFRH